MRIGDFDVHVTVSDRDHGPDFWRAVGRPLPDFAARRTRLRLTRTCPLAPGRH